MYSPSSLATLAILLGSEVFSIVYSRSPQATISGRLFYFRSGSPDCCSCTSIILKPPILDSRPPSRRLMEHYTAVKISRSHQYQLADHEVSHCSESPQCSCSECKTEVAFGSFTTTHDQSAIKSALRKESEPKIGCLGDGNRCDRWNCPICHPGRSQRAGPSTAASSLMLESFCSQGLSSSERRQRRHGHDQAPNIAFFGDGGHTCRRFPCPVCGSGGRSAA